MAIDAVNTVGAAFVAGLVTSVHCVGMCGPLGCSLVTMRAGQGERQLAAVAYHGGRMASYVALGAIVGMLGYLPMSRLADSPAVVVPWFLVIALLLIGLGLDRKMPRPAFLMRRMARLRLRVGRMSATRGGLLLGLATPMLPCGPLYVMLGIALVSGSALRGAEFMFAFAMGTVPLLWVAQNRMGILQQKLGPGGMAAVQRGVAVLAALVLAWRLRGTLWFVESPIVGCGCH